MITALRDAPLFQHIYPVVVRNGGQPVRDRQHGPAFAEQIERRRAISVEQYEAVERRRQGYIDAGTYKPATDTFGDHYQSFYQGKCLLVLRGLEDYFRTYDWS